MRLLTGLALGLLAAPLAANAEVVFYSNNFESGLGGGWGTAAQITNHAAFSSYVGRYSGNQGILLSVPRPTTPALQQGESVEYRLTFDFFAIDSWDGDDPNFGPDRLSIAVNGSVVFAETFSNQHEYQSFIPATVGPVNLGYGEANDSIYRAITVPFTIGSASTISINWFALGLQGISDESWGVDNVNVSYAVVPAPAGAAALALGGIVAIRRRRREQDAPSR